MPIRWRAGSSATRARRFSRMSARRTPACQISWTTRRSISGSNAAQGLVVAVSAGVGVALAGGSGVAVALGVSSARVPAVKVWSMICPRAPRMPRSRLLMMACKPGAVRRPNDDGIAAVLENCVWPRRALVADLAVNGHPQPGARDNFKLHAHITFPLDGGSEQGGLRGLGNLPARRDVRVRQRRGARRLRRCSRRRRERSCLRVAC